MQSGLLSIKTNYTIAEGAFDTAPVAGIELSGTISSTESDKVFKASGLTDDEISVIKQFDGIVINGELCVVSKYDTFNDNIYLQQPYGGSDFTDQPLVWSAGPMQPGYPREWSVKGQLYNQDGVATSAVAAYPYNKQKKKLVLIEALSGPVQVSSAILSPDSGSGSGGSSSLVAVFEPDTVVVGGEGVGYIEDSRMANKPRPPYFYIITVDGVPLNIYSATASDNEVEYNADESLGRFDAINSFEFTSDVTILVTIYLLS